MREAGGVPRMMTLDHVDLRQRARVVEIEGGRGVRSHLASLGIRVGDWITVVERAPFRGPMLVEVDGTRVALGRGVASKIRVEEGGMTRALLG